MKIRECHGGFELPCQVVAHSGTRSLPLSLNGQPSLCGAEEDRTPDLFVANEALSQLSYSPKSVFVRATFPPLGEDPN